MTIKKIAIASDHAAFTEKAALISFLEKHGYSIIDCGTDSVESCHYPNYVFKAIDALKTKKAEFSILLCGTGIGVSMVANKFKNIRAGLCRSVDEAKLTRQHNDANVLCLGARINSMDELINISKSFLSENFEGGRHQKRLDLFDDLGELNVP